MTERRLRIAAKLFGLAVLKRIRTGNERTHFATFELTGERTAEAYAVAREAGDLVKGQDRLTTIDGPGPEAGKPLWLSESVWCEVEAGQRVYCSSCNDTCQDQEDPTGQADCRDCGGAFAWRKREAFQRGELPALGWEFCGEGPWTEQADAQDFLDAEVGMPGARVVQAGDVWRIEWPKGGA